MMIDMGKTLALWSHAGTHGSHRLFYTCMKIMNRLNSIDKMLTLFSTRKKSVLFPCIGFSYVLYHIGHLVAQTHPHRMEAKVSNSMCECECRV